MKLRAEHFKPTHYITTEDGSRLLVMLAYSKKHQEKVVYSQYVDSQGQTKGAVVETMLREGHNNALYFQRNKMKYYLAWAKPLSKRVDKN